MEAKETMLTYIKEEKECCTKILANRKSLLSPLIDYMKVNKSLKRITFLATGSSLNEVNCCKNYLSDILKVEVDVKNPFIYKYYENYTNTDALYIGVSQSGSSYSTIEAIKKVKENNCDHFVLTSNLKSAISKATSNLIDMGCGEEKVGFVTKGFSATVLNILLMGIEGALAKETIDQKTYENEISKLEATIVKIDYVIGKSMEWFDRNEEEFKKAKRVVAIGYGAGYGVACEADTKITETVRIPCTGHELEEYMHGPYLELDDSNYLFYIESKGILEERNSLLKKYTSDYTNHIFTVTCGNSENPKDISVNCNTGEYFSTLLLVIPFQILAYRLSKSIGIDLSVSPFPDFDSVLKSKVK